MDPTARTASVLALEVADEAVEAVREALAGHERSVLDNGILIATFDAVPAAVEAAASAIRRSRRLAHSGEDARAGLAHGEVVSEGRGISGRAVAEAEALCRAARGGQILVTDLVRRLMGDDRSVVEAEDVPAPPLEEPIETWELRPAGANGSRSPIPLPGPLSAARRGGRLVGRLGELDAIERLWEAVRGGERRAVLVAGEPGIGKTRLAAEIGTDLHAQGATVLYGRSDEGVDAPYQPFVEALGRYAEHEAADVLAGVGPEGGALRTLVPALGGAAAGESPLQGRGSGQQYVLFSAVASLLAAASARRPIVLIVEDLHWADESTLLLFRHLLSSPAPLAVLIVATYRSTDARGNTHLARALSELRREEAVHHLELAGLEEREVASLVEDLAGNGLAREHGIVAGSIRTETGGNPLFVTEVVRGLAGSQAAGGVEDRPPPGSAGASLPIPATVREAIRGRVEGLGTEVRGALEVAAVVGREFDGGLVARIADLGPETVAEAFDRAQHAALVAESPGGGGRLAFCHPLIARTLYDDQGAAGRGRTHRKVAEAIEAAIGDSPGANALALARHWYDAFPPDERKVIEWCERAGRAALERFDAPTAARWYRRAIEVHGRSGGGDDEHRCDLLIGLGTAQRQGGEPAFRDTLLEAGRLAQRRGDRERLIRAVLANSRGFVSASGEVDEERIALLGAALDAVGDDDSSDRASLLALLAAELSFSGEWERRVALSDEALATARRVGDRTTLSDVLTARFVTIWMPETLGERLANTAEDVALADELGDPVAQFGAIHWRGVALVQAGELPEATRAVEREDRLARTLGDPTALWMATYDRANMAMIAGRLEEAEALANEALEIGTGSGQPDALPFYASQLADIRHEQGRLSELQPMIAEVVAENPGIPGFRALLALAYAEGELLDEAGNVLAIDAATDFSELPRDVTWLAAHVIFAHVCADIGEAAPAGTLYERLAPWPDQVVYTGISALGDVDHALGRLATVLGRYAEAERHLVASAERCRRIGAPVWVARVSLDTGRLLLLRDEPGDRERAASLLERAAADAQRLGAATIARRANSLREYERASAVIEAALGPARRLAMSGPRPRKARDSEVAGARERPAGARERPAASAEAGGEGASASLRCEGDVWAVSFAGGESRLKHSKGLGYLARLLARPGVELHVVELQSGSGTDASAQAEAAVSARGAAEAGLAVRAAGSGDAGEALDPEAKRAYRARVEELREDVEEAERFNDPERVARAREELEFVGRELAAAVGLGGRDRRAASEAERARVNVTRAIRKAIARIAELNPALGGHLDASVSTGTFCVYEPRPGDEIAWELDAERAG